jgi:NAD(P)-dependent dehydrogenase (short-subunit alcohol dehydrogenase family)
MAGLCEGRVCIITGAGRGIGREHALMLAEHGAKVVVNDLGGSMDGEGASGGPAHDVSAEIVAAGGQAVANTDDISDWAGAGRLVQQAIDEFGRLDVLVNNAGILRDRMMFSMPPEDFDAVVKVHLYGTFNTMRHASAYWRSESKEGRQPSASIVNTVSSAGLQGQESQINYGAAKAGIAAMTVIAGLELARYGVRANCIGPGGFTRMVGQARPDIEIKHPEDYEAFTPMNPGNSAPAVVWLASDESKPTTGQVLRMVGNSLCVYRPWEMGEEFFATDDEGNPARWEPAKVGHFLNRYHFQSTNPGMHAQYRR